MIEDEKWIEAAVRLWETPHENENTLLIQRTGFDGPANGVPNVDRVTNGAWVLAWVFVSDDEITNG